MCVGNFDAYIAPVLLTQTCGVLAATLLVIPASGRKGSCIFQFEALADPPLWLHELYGPTTPAQVSPSLHCVCPFHIHLQILMPQSAGCLTGLPASL